MTFLPGYSLPLSPKIPGHLALNSFSEDQRRILLVNLDPAEQEVKSTASIYSAHRISLKTSNPFLRANLDQEAWDEILLILVAKGFEARGLYQKSLKGLQDLLG